MTVTVTGTQPAAPELAAPTTAPTFAPDPPDPPDPEDPEEAPVVTGRTVTYLVDVEYWVVVVVMLYIEN